MVWPFKTLHLALFKAYLTFKYLLVQAGPSPKPNSKFSQKCDFNSLAGTTRISGFRLKKKREARCVRCRPRSARTPKRRREQPTSYPTNWLSGCNRLRVPSIVHRRDGCPSPARDGILPWDTLGPLGRAWAFEMHGRRPWWTVLTAPAPARPGTGAVWTPVGARAVAEPSRSPWIVAQPAAGNTQAAARDASWADPFSRFKNQERVPRGKFQTKSWFRKLNLSVTFIFDRMTKKTLLWFYPHFFLISKIRSIWP